MFIPLKVITEMAKEVMVPLLKLKLEILGYVMCLVFPLPDDGDVITVGPNEFP